jgi:hypothetical protein
MRKMQIARMRLVQLGWYELKPAEMTYLCCPLTYLMSGLRYDWF